MSPFLIYVTLNGMNYDTALFRLDVLLFYTSLLLSAPHLNPTQLHDVSHQLPWPCKTSSGIATRLGLQKGMQ